MNREEKTYALYKRMARAFHKATVTATQAALGADAATGKRTKPPLSSSLPLSVWLTSGIAKPLAQG